jgi:hypothetical protein
MSDIDSLTFAVLAVAAVLLAHVEPAMSVFWRVMAALCVIIAAYSAMGLH